MIELVPQSISSALDFAELFGRVAPVEVDLGCGDGSFLQSIAVLHPERNFLGVERLLHRVRSSDRKSSKLANICIIRSETMFVLKHLLQPNSVSTFYLLFPDPWPKRRHHRRRMVTSDFLSAIWLALTNDGCLHIATDHDDYFTAMHRLLANSGFFAFDSISPALPQTTFEKKFISGGLPIHRLALRKVSPVR